MAASVVDEIKSRLDVVDLLGEYIHLQKAGRNYKALCPFHSEKTPSFIVFPDTQSWHCFGACQTGGDIFSFVMKKENVDFAEALRILAEKAGVTLHAERPNSDSDKLDRLRQLNAAAAAHFRKNLQRHPAAALARQYIAQRGLNDAICDQFQIGYALDSWDDLLKAMISLGFDKETLVEAGLNRTSEDGRSQYDRFRGRLMFPISDKQGRIVGFGGRILGKGEPKYLNTPQTLLFDKSSILYGLAQARRAIREQDSVVIVEGYMDVLAAHQFGYHNVIASMGTALTEAQLRQLKREAENVILALDADSAGQQATLRGLEVARETLERETVPVPTASGLVRFEERLQTNIFVLFLPEGKDPDEFIRAHPEAWPEVVAKAVPIIDFYMQQVITDIDLTTANGKAKAVNRIAPIIKELSDDIKRYHYVQRLARLLKMDERYLLERFAGQGGYRRRLGYKQGRSAAQPRAENKVTAPNKEDYILAQLMRYPTMLADIHQALDRLGQRPLRADELENSANQALFRQLQQYDSSPTINDPISADNPFLTEQQIHLINSMGGQPELPYEERLADIVDVILHLRLERQREALMRIHQLLNESDISAEESQQYLSLYRRYSNASYDLQQALKRRTI